MFIINYKYILNITTMSEYNKSFNHYIDTRTKFWLHAATYEEAFQAKQEYLTQRKNILGY